MTNITKRVQSTDGTNAVAMKPSGAIEIISSDVSLIQRKTWNILLANSYPDISKKQSYKIPIANICRLLGYKDYISLSKSIEKLVSTTIKFNYLQSRDKSEWLEITSLLAQATIKDGYLTYGYSSMLQEKISSHEYYAKINLLIQKNIDSKYALILYEMAKNHYIESKGYGFTPFIPIDDLRSILGCSNNKLYSDFKYFNARVIKRAVKEVNSKSEIKITAIPHRVKRVVDSIQFRIEAKDDKSGMLNALAGPKQRELQLAGNELYNRLINEYEISAQQAVEIINNYDEDYIREKLVYVTQVKTKGKVKTSLGALTYDAIIKNYVIPAVEAPKKMLPAIRPGMKIEYQHKEYILDDSLVISTKKGTLTEYMIREGIANRKIKIIEE